MCFLSGHTVKTHTHLLYKLKKIHIQEYNYLNERKKEQVKVQTHGTHPGITKHRHSHCKVYRESSVVSCYELLKSGPNSSPRNTEKAQLKVNET